MNGQAFLGSTALFLDEGKCCASMFRHDRSPSVENDLVATKVAMKKAWCALAFCAVLSLPAPALAADSTIVGLGSGAVAGALVGGPIGAVVGAVAGGFIGANSESARPRYRRRAAASGRRAVQRPAPVRANLASRAVPASDAIRPASSAQPVPHSPASEVDTTPVKNTGSTGSAWKDPY